MNEYSGGAETAPIRDPAIPAPDELIARARAMVPALRRRARACEEQRRVPEDSFNEMKAAGLMNVCKPKEHGGYELGWDVLAEICFELGRGCGSTGWVFAVLAEHNHTVAGYSLEAQADIWGDEQDTFIASGNSPDTAMERVEGGWKINGQLNYSSGCDFADWHLTGMPIGDKAIKILIPQSECEIVDNWQVFGLAGTGSKDIKMDGVFIPDHRTINIGQPGPRFHDAALFRLPQWSVNPYDLAMVVIGIAQGALEIFIEGMKTRSSRFGEHIAGYQSLQLRIAESSAEIDAAKRIVLANLGETMAVLENADEVPIEMRARNKRDMAYCPRLAASAIDRIFYAEGAGGMFLANDLQRSFRDVQAGIRQIALNWDINGTTYGKVALGLDPSPVRW